LDRLLRTSDGIGPTGIRDRAMLEFIYETGCRVSEACNLTLDNLHASPGEGRWALIVDAKGGKTREVYLGESSSWWIQRYLEVREQISKKHSQGPYVFISNRGCIYRSTPWKHIKECARRAGIDPARVFPHVLRHSIATHLLEAGVGTPMIQQILGHTKLSTTQIYTRVGIRELQDQYNKYHPLA
jgi:integrase/recombinase XerD